MANFVPPAHDSASPFTDMRGQHVAVRTPDLETAKRWYVESLDFRVVAERDYGDQKLAYIAPPTDDHFYVEIFGGGDPRVVRPYNDLADSLKYAGYHHFCLIVSSPPSRPISALAPIASTNRTISIAYMRGMSNRL